MFYWKKTIDLSASKTLGLPFIFYIGIFKDIFLLILLYFWNCHFILKTNTHFSIENQLVFAGIIFSTENQYKIFYWITCTFSTCDFVLKTNTIFSSENQLIFRSVICLMKISTKCSIECTVHFKLLFDDRDALFCVENQL